MLGYMQESHKTNFISDLIDYEASVDLELQDFVVGIVGNNNSDRTDDFQLLDGTVLDEDLSPEQLYGEFAPSWHITQAESWFDYEPGKNTVNFPNLFLGKNTLIGIGGDDLIFAGADNDILLAIMAVIP